MRFMVMVKATKDSEAGKLPGRELMEAMGRYNEELAKAGILLAGEGLQPSSKGARVRFSGEKRIVVRSGTTHRFTGVWTVVVRGRVFVRSWNDAETGWHRAFREDPRGAI